MSDKSKPLTAPISDSQAELQMRRALGLQGTGRSAPVQQRPDQARARHRFVQDGGVPVTVVNRADADATAPFKARIGELEAALDTERSAHAATKRALAEAQAAAHAAQTRLTHAELSQRDVLEAERHARDAAEAAQQQVASLRAAQAAAAKPVRKAQPIEQEPQPVKWWLPNHKAKTT